MREELLELNLEELRDERSRKVKDENLGENEHGVRRMLLKGKMRMYLSAFRSFLGDLKGGLEPVGKEIAF